MMSLGIKLETLSTEGHALTNCAILAPGLVRSSSHSKQGLEQFGEVLFFICLL